MVNTFTRAYFLPIMGPQRGKRGFLHILYRLFALLRKVNAAGHFIKVQIFANNFDFRSLTAVGSGK